MDYLIVLAGSIACLFFLILVTNKGKRQGHWFLALLLLLVIINCYFVFSLMGHSGDYYVPVFSELNYAIPMLYGTLLWLYARALTLKDYRWAGKELLHLVPFFMFFGYLLIKMIINGQDETVAFLGYPLIKLIINPIYIFMTIGMLYRHRKELYQQYSHADQINHDWLTWIAYGGLLLWIVACLGNIFNWYHGFEHEILGDYLLIGFLGILLFLLAIVGFNRTQIFQSIEIAPLAAIEPTKMVNDASTEAQSTHSDIAVDNRAEALSTYLHLQQVMQKHEPYLDPTLSLHRLADISNISTNRLSYAINQIGGQNFYDFVNGYRVEAVKHRLKTDDLTTYSILGIAEECGFNSKASFNRIFKKVAGMTPTQYIKVSTSSK